MFYIDAQELSYEHYLNNIFKDGRTCVAHMGLGCKQAARSFLPAGRKIPLPV